MDTQKGRRGARKPHRPSPVRVALLVATVVAGAGLGWPQKILYDLGPLTSGPVVGQFLREYGKLDQAHDFSGAASAALRVLAEHPGDRDIQIAGNYCFALAKLNQAAMTGASASVDTGRPMLGALGRCRVLLMGATSEEREHKYARLEGKLVPLLTVFATDFAGSRSETVRMAWDFIAQDPDGPYSPLALTPLVKSFHRTRDLDGLTSSLIAMAQDFQGKRVEAFILRELGALYLVRGQNERVPQIIERLKTAFPDQPLQWRGLESLREAPKKAPPKIVENGQAATSGCGCGCGGTTATMAAPPATKATSGTVAGSCCTTACATTTAAAAKKPQ